MSRIHYPFPSMKQFREVISSVNHLHQNNPSNQVIEFTGTVKLHGTNTSIVLTKDGDFYTQSRTQVLIDGSTQNFGFPEFVFSNIERKTFIQNQMQSILDKFTEKNHDNTLVGLVLFGEFAGAGIQKKVAISQMDRFFSPFAVAIVYEIDKTEEDGSITKSARYDWIFKDEQGNDILQLFKNDNYRIYPTTMAQIKKITVDFSDKANLLKAQQEMVDFTNQVEKECPFAKLFGITGLGEGVVYRDSTGQFSFKVKGEKHSVSKVKTLAAITPEQIEHHNKIQGFVDYAVTENRLEQMHNELLLEMNTDFLSSKEIKAFISKVVADVHKEESDVIQSNGLSDYLKELNHAIITKARKWFLNKI